MTEPSDDEVFRTRNDLEMMNRPYLWPMYPWLPLKKYVEGSPGIKTAKLWAVPKGPEPKRIVVLNTTIFGPVGQDEEVVLYDSFEAILDDGWKVD